MPTAVGRKDYRQKRNRAIAGAFTAADSERKVSLRSPAGNSSRRISQSVERSRRRACASGMDSRQRHRSDDIRVHQYLLGYASDLNFLPVALQPHGIGFLERAFRSPLLITLCGSIVRSILMNGYFIAWRALPPPAPGALFAASFILRMALWSLQPCRKG